LVQVCEQAHAQLLSQLDELVQLLEADVPANPASPQNQKHERKYEAVLRSYFGDLEDAFPYGKLEELYNKFVVTESIREAKKPYKFDAETGSILNPVLKILRAKLIADITGQHVVTYLAGIAQVTEWGKTQTGRPIYFEGPPTQQAIDYAKDHCAKMVTKMDIETKDRLARVISDGIKNKRGVPGLTRDIKSVFTDMKRYRAKMIARTETADALEQAFIDRSKALEVPYKESIRGANEYCDVCTGNEAAGVIPIDEPFPSGHMRPPFHPNCICALAPVMKKEER
jgi:hypothetical protein